MSQPNFKRLQQQPVGVTTLIPPFVETIQGIIQKVFDLAARQINPALVGKY